MGRGIAIGFVLGAVLAAGLFYGVRSARGGTGEASGAKQGSDASDAAAVASGPDAAKLKADLDAAAAERASLTKDLEALDGKLAAARIAKSGRDSAARKSRNPWSKLGRKLYELRATLDEMGESGDPEAQKLMAEILAIFMELGEKHKVPMNDLEGSPWVMPMLMLAILEGSDLPPDAEQTAKLDAVIASAESAWSEYEAGRKEMTALEAQRVQAGMLGGALNGLKAEMTPEQVGIFETIKIFNRNEARGYTSQTNGSRQEIAENFTKQWGAELGLDASQSAILTPVVTEYMSAYDAFQAEWKLKELSGQPMDEFARSMAQMDLMIAAQKKISETVTLDDKQKKKMKAWSQVYGFEVK